MVRGKAFSGWIFLGSTFLPHDHDVYQPSPLRTCPFRSVGQLDDMDLTTDKQFLFVIGSPRSGTTWLHRMLTEHPSVAGLEGELTVFSYLRQWELRYQKEKYYIDRGERRQGIPRIYDEEEFYQGLRSLAHQAYGRLLERKPQATHILDKHPGYALCMPLIDRLVPQTRFVHVIRDGREVAVSMMSAQKRAGFGAGDIKGASRDWADHLRTARSEGRKLGPERYLEVRYEEMTADPGNALKKVLHFADLALPDAEVARIVQAYDIDKKQVSWGDSSLNKLRKTPGAIWQKKLSLEERWIMDRMVGDLLQELGYAEPHWWALKNGDKARMAVYPLFRRSMNTAGSALHTWRTPVVKRLEP